MSFNQNGSTKLLKSVWKISKKMFMPINGEEFMERALRKVRNYFCIGRCSVGNGNPVFAQMTFPFRYRHLLTRLDCLRILQLKHQFSKVPFFKSWQFRQKKSIFIKIDDMWNFRIFQLLKQCGVHQNENLMIFFEFSLL